MRLTFLGGVQTVTGSCYLIQEEQELLKLVFSGDLGRYHSLILKNPTPIDNAHVLLVESTYGNRLHKSLEASEFDKETLDLMKTDPYPFSFPGLKMVRSAKESRVLNSIEEGVIIAGSGMCTGGRIKHHLKHNLWKSNTHIIFAGFQTKGTLGRGKSSRSWKASWAISRTKWRNVDNTPTSPPLENVWPA